MGRVVGVLHRGRCDLYLFDEPAVVGIDGVETVDHVVLVGVGGRVTEGAEGVHGLERLLPRPLHPTVHALRLVDDDDGVRGANEVDGPFAAGLLAVLCVGETLSERQASQEEAVIHTQLAATLGRIPVDRWSAITLAYEPVWAIGTGRTPTNEEIAEVHNAMRNQINERFGPDAANLRLLYGGSVNPGNAIEIMSILNVNGGLVGGASLRAETFWPILHACE